MGKCIKELERIYGVEHGNNRYTNKTPKLSESKTQEELAEMIGISVDTLNNYKKLTELIPELEDLVNTGIVTPTTALAMMQKKLTLWIGCLLINYLLKICLLVKNLL